MILTTADCEAYRGKHHVARLFSYLAVLILYVDTVGCGTMFSRDNRNDALNHFHNGLDLQKKGELDQAIAEYRTAHRLDPNHVEPLAKLGEALTTKGDLDGAISGSCTCKFGNRVHG